MIYYQLIISKNTIKLTLVPDMWRHIDGMYAIDEALRCKKTGEKKVIAFNNCGHGLLDLQAYENFLSGNLKNMEPAEIKTPNYL